jgi:hypothetical protein
MKFKNSNLTSGTVFIYKGKIFWHFSKLNFVLAIPVEHRSG